MKSTLLGRDAHQRSLRLDPDDRKTHMHVIGSSGSGKSKFLESLMREDLKNCQGFCLIDPHGSLYHDVASYCAHHVLNRDIILLDLSEPEAVIGFNPFQRAPLGDVSVQVDRRINATLHAWGVADADQTPTLARTLRLIYTVMIERNLGLPQIQHLIDFNAGAVREHLVAQLTSSPLVQKEWRELQMLKAKEWRDETLSAKNRMFKFLTSDSICRFMGLPGRSINLQEIMDQGKVLLVNLAQSDHLSHENARAFGALLVNEFFETALCRKRDALGKDPKPYYLIMDEFQNFVSLDIANMLDEVRKFGLFMVLAHQRFGQLDDDVTDAVLTNCRIKAVFGGLPIESARRMAEELFIGELDSKKIKVAIYQTKFWPEYRRDKAYSRSSSHGSSSGRTESRSSGDSSGSSTGMSYEASYFMPDQWFAITDGFTRSKLSSTATSWGSSSGSSESESYADSEGESDIPIFFPVPFQELSNIQYYTTEEQLTELTAALKEQFPRHCFIKIQGQKTQPLLVPFVKPFYTSAKNLAWYRQQQLQKQNALAGAEVDRLLQEQEGALVRAAARGLIIETPVAESNPVIEPELAETARDGASRTKKNRISASIWNRTANNSGVLTIGTQSSLDNQPTADRKRGVRRVTQKNIPEGA